MADLFGASAGRVAIEITGDASGLTATLATVKSELDGLAARFAATGAAADHAGDQIDQMGDRAAAAAAKMAALGGIGAAAGGLGGGGGVGGKLFGFGSIGGLLMLITPLTTLIGAAVVAAGSLVAVGGAMLGVAVGAAYFAHQVNYATAGAADFGKTWDKAVSLVGGSLASLGQQIGQSLGGTAHGALMTITADIQLMISQAGPMITGFIQKLSGLGGSLAKVFLAPGASGMSLFQQWGQIIGNFVSTGGQGLLHLFVSLQAPAQALVNGIAQLIHGFTTMSQAFSGGTIGLATQFIQQFFNLLTGLIPAWTAVTTATNSVSVSLLKVANAALPSVNVGLQILAQGLRIVGTGISSMLGWVVSGLNALGPFGHALGGLALDAFLAAKAFGAIKASAFGAWIATTATSLTQFTQVWSKFGGGMAFAAFFPKISGLISGLGGLATVVPVIGLAAAALIGLGYGLSRVSGAATLAAEKFHHAGAGAIGVGRVWESNVKQLSGVTAGFGGHLNSVTGSLHSASTAQQQFTTSLQHTTGALILQVQQLIADKGALVGLSGGFLGIQGAMFATRSAQFTLIQAQRTWNADVKAGRQHTLQGKQDLLSLQQAGLAAVQSYQALRAQILGYMAAQVKAKTPTADVIAQTREFAKQAGFTSKQTDALVQSVLGLIRADSGIPSKKVTQYLAPGLASVTANAISLHNILSSLNNRTINIYFKAHHLN